MPDPKWMSHPCWDAFEHMWRLESREVVREDMAKQRGCKPEEISDEQIDPGLVEAEYENRWLT